MSTTYSLQFTYGIPLGKAGDPLVDRIERTADDDFLVEPVNDSDDAEWMLFEPGLAISFGSDREGPLPDLFVEIATLVPPKNSRLREHAAELGIPEERRARAGWFLVGMFG